MFLVVIMLLCLPSMKVPHTLVFEYPTARQVVAFLAFSSEPAAGIASDAKGGAAVHSGDAVHSSDDAHSGEAPHICGSSCVLPGGSSAGEAAAMSPCLRNLLEEVPFARWDITHTMGTQPVEVYQRIRHGGFVSAAELFDLSRFKVSPAEAAAMDPQQRLLLERGYSSLHAAALNAIPGDAGTREHTFTRALAARQLYPTSLLSHAPSTR